jgi:hypothetical protein
MSRGSRFVSAPQQCWHAPPCAKTWRSSAHRRHNRIAREMGYLTADQIRRPLLARAVGRIRLNAFGRFGDRCRALLRRRLRGDARLLTAVWPTRETGRSQKHAACCCPPPRCGTVNKVRPTAPGSWVQHNRLTDRSRPHLAARGHTLAFRIAAGHGDAELSFLKVAASSQLGAPSHSALQTNVLLDSDKPGTPLERAQHQHRGASGKRR